MTAKKVTVYWTERHESALQAVYQHMLDQGIPCEHNGKPNLSAILQYALEQTAKKRK